MLELRYTDKPSKPLSETLKEGLTWAVVDQSHPDCSFVPTKWKLVEHALLDIFLAVMDSNPSPSPGCRDAGWYQEHIKLVACSDFRSMELHKEAISRIGEVWPGARLAAVSPDQIPNRPRSKARIPTGPSDPETIFRLLKASNNRFPTHNWKKFLYSGVITANR